MRVQGLPPGEVLEHGEHMDLRSRLLLGDNILVVTVHDHVGTEQRATLAGDVDRLLDEDRPAGLVAALSPAAASAAAVSVLLRL
ncbi:hypothetical protein [Streptomyces erythrochromogenes]|uniref:hypothetical protein n=1 Tax=Streptomyces erythrochromogenes TaxID=285574 RepID=UPI0036AD0C3A